MTQNNSHPQPDEGHQKLIAALTDLLHEASQFEFHDFKNTEYACPKAALVHKLTVLIGRVKTGDFDN